MVNRILYLAAVTVATAILIPACGKTTRVTKEEVDRRIKQEIPLGSSQAHVVGFLNSLEVNGIKAEHWGYMPERPTGTYELAGRQSLVEGYIKASMRNVAQEPRKLQVYRIEMTFYFGKGELLIDYRLETLGDW